MKRFVNSILLLKSLASLSTAVHPWTIFTIKNVPPKLARITINKIITFFIKGSNIIVGSSVTLLALTDYVGNYYRSLLIQEGDAYFFATN